MRYYARCPPKVRMLLNMIPRKAIMILADKGIAYSIQSVIGSGSSSVVFGVQRLKLLIVNDDSSIQESRKKDKSSDKKFVLSDAFLKLRGHIDNLFMETMPECYIYGKKVYRVRRDIKVENINEVAKMMLCDLGRSDDVGGLESTVTPNMYITLNSLTLMMSMDTYYPGGAVKLYKSMRTGLDTGSL